MSEKGRKQFKLGKSCIRKAYASQNKVVFRKFFRQAVQHFRMAAYVGHADAQFELGLKYDGTGFLGENMKKAMYWYVKAAENGHAEACNNIGFRYNHSIGVKKNSRTAISWYKKGADRGSKLAKQNLAKSLRRKKSVSEGTVSNRAGA